MLKAQLEQQSKAVDTIISNMRTLESKLAGGCPACPALLCGGDGVHGCAAALLYDGQAPSSAPRSFIA